MALPTVTITDVAKHVGVSVATISRYLSGFTVRNGEKIREAIIELNYRPSAAARNLKSGRTGIIAIVVPDITNPFFASIVEGAEGSISVDNCDISKIPLSYLRNRISIIPQESTLFSGTFRFNVDPFEEYTDEKIWWALAKVNLTEEISNLPGKLDGLVAEYGENFSQGTRQLVCLARALD